MPMGQGQKFLFPDLDSACKVTYPQKISLETNDL
jgi:hypothetical protein